MTSTDSAVEAIASFLPATPQLTSLLLLALGLMAAGSQMREMFRDLGSGPGIRKELAER